MMVEVDDVGVLYAAKVLNQFHWHLAACEGDFLPLRPVISILVTKGTFFDGYIMYIMKRVVTII